LRPLAERGSYLVHNRLKGESFKVGPEEHFLLERLDGIRTVHQLCALFEERFDQPLTRDELQDFMSLAREREFLQPEDSGLPRSIGDGTDMAFGADGRTSPSPSPYEEEAPRANSSHCPHSAPEMATRIEAAGAASSKLAWLLNPVDVCDFVSTWWQHAALYISGSPGKFADLFSRDKFVDSATRMFEQATSGRPVEWMKLNAGFEDADGNQRELAIQPEQIPDFLRAGWTIQAERIDAVDPLLRDLARSLKDAIRIPGEADVAAFLSPHGSGYGLHYDGLAQWVLQIAGAKRWWYSSRPAVSFPLTRRVLAPEESAQGADGLYRADEMREQLLCPGDVLYLPAGTWHRPRAEGESLHLCLTVRHMDYLQLLSEILSPALLVREDWRHLPMPPALDGDLEQMSPQLEAQFADRLLELRGAVDALRPIDLYNAWWDRIGIECAAPIAHRGDQSPLDGAQRPSAVGPAS
jgi:ribosomal protein L16 Arg81 hydroxylase